MATMSRQRYVGARREVRVREAREEGLVVVERTRSDGSLGWFTGHLTRWGARYAAWRWRRNGHVAGIVL